MDLKLHIIDAEIENPVLNLEEIIQFENKYEDYEQIRSLVEEFKLSVKENPESVDNSHQLYHCLDKGWFLVRDLEGSILYNPHYERDYCEGKLYKKVERLSYLNRVIDKLLKEAKGIEEMISGLPKEKLLDETNQELEDELDLIQSETESQEKELTQKEKELEEQLNQAKEQLNQIKEEKEKKMDEIEKLKSVVRKDVVEYFEDLEKEE